MGFTTNGTKELKIVYKETSKLIPYALNSRTHSEDQVKQIAASIKEFGFTNPILIDEDNGVIAGHGRLMAAGVLELAEVPTITLKGLTDAQRKAYVIADNKLALNAAWDVDALKTEFMNLSELGFDLDLLGFDNVEMGKLFDDNDGELEIRDEPYSEVFSVIVDCENEMEQEKVFNRLDSEGYKCRVQKFVVSAPIPKTFRTEKVKGMFDVEMDTVDKHFDVSIPIEELDWNVGLIVGASGSGKTTIAKNLFTDFLFFQGFDWRAGSLVDDFAEDFTPKQITEALSKVGFSSPPDWLKPFGVLSNGQKMRAELARLILENDKPVIYDEFTSVVDRQVAQIGSAAIQKFIRKQNKQFIAVSCHYDIEEWLEPDWCYDVNTHEFHRRLLRRPPIEINVREAGQHEWKQFMEFHYLTHAHNKSAHKYIAEINGEPVGWCSVLHFAHPHRKNTKRLHRTVVKPDYQGLGIGYELRCQVAQRYVDQGYSVITVTSNPALIHAMSKRKEWAMTRKPSRLSNTAKTGVLAGSTSDARLTASFQYVGTDGRRQTKN